MGFGDTKILETFFCRSTFHLVIYPCFCFPVLVESNIGRFSSRVLIKISCSFSKALSGDHLLPLQLITFNLSIKILLRSSTKLRFSNLAHFLVCFQVFRACWTIFPEIFQILVFLYDGLKCRNQECGHKCLKKKTNPVLISCSRFPELV